MQVPPSPASRSASQDPELSIVIVNWNSREHVRACLQSIERHPSAVRLETIVVDSGSFDGCREMLQGAFPHVVYVQCEDNIGFGLANNFGVSHAHAPRLLLLNPDTEVQPGAIDVLVQAAKSLPQRGILGARLLNSDHSLQQSCVLPSPSIANQVLDSRFLQRKLPRNKLWLSAFTYEPGADPVPVEALSGACMLLSRALFLEVGGFSSDYFMYAEDLDLCFRVRAQGLVNYYVPGARIVHHGGGSSSRAPSVFSTVMARQSLMQLLCKTHNSAYAHAYRASMGLSAAIRLLVLALLSPWWLLRGEARLFLWSLRKWLTILRWSLGLEAWVARYRPGPPQSGDDHVRP